MDAWLCIAQSPLPKRGDSSALPPTGKISIFICLLVLKEKVDKGNPENKKQTSPHAQGEGRSLPEFSHDPAKVEREAGRVTSDASRMKDATGKGWLIAHRSKYE
jgi:hypothetical protein